MQKTTIKKNLKFSCFKLTFILCLYIGMISVVNAQVVLEQEVKISDFGLHFNGSKVSSSAPNTGETSPYDYFFGKNISAHGDCIKSYNEYVFMTWYRGGKGDRHVMLTRYNTITRTMATIEFPHRHTGYQNRWWIGESHNTIGIGISPIDGTIHLLYDMHAYSRTRPSNGSLANDYFRYSYSQKNVTSLPDNEFTLDKFVQNANGGYKHLSLNGGEDYTNFQGLTYPQFFVNDSGDLFMYMREGGNNNGAYKFSKYTASTSSWSNFTSFNVLGARNRGEAYNWGLYGNMKYLNGKIRVGFQRRSSNNTDKFQYQNGVYYAYSDNQSGADSWKNHNGVPFSLPLIDADKTKVFEPGNLVETTAQNQVYIVGGFDWTVTGQGDVHIISRVSDNENGVTKHVHNYKPAGAIDFITSTEFSGAEAIYTSGKDVYIIGLNNDGRVFVEKAKGGTNNFRTVYEATSGKIFDHGAVHIADGKLYYYLMEKGSGNALPLYLQVINLDILATPESLTASIITPFNNENLSFGKAVTISATAFTDFGIVTKVDFRIDGQLYQSDNLAPFAVNWNPSITGQHTIDVVAYSSSSEVYTSQAVTVFIDEKDYSDLSGDIYRLKNVATGMYLQSNNTELAASDSPNGLDKEWEFVKSGSGDYYNIDSQTTRGILRFAGGTAGTMINTGFGAPKTDDDKIWTIIYDEVNRNYAFETKSSSRYLYHDANGNIVHASNTDDRSKWIVESTTAILSVNDYELNSQSVKVYPNPANNKFTIALKGLGKAKVVINDMLGKVVYNNITSAKSLEVKRNENFTTGIYIIKVVANGKLYHSKLVIK